MVRGFFSSATGGGRRILLSVLFLAAISLGTASASEWMVGGSKGHPGDKVQISLVLRSDGVTSGADITLVLDQTRLTIEAPPGEMDSASRVGRCGWNGADEVVALVFSGGVDALAKEDLLVCEFDIRIRSEARSGQVPIVANSAHCAGVGGESVECRVLAGHIEILGELAPAPPPLESTSAIVLLRSRDDWPIAPQGSADWMPSIESFVDVPPLYVRSLLSEDIQGRREDRAQLKPGSPLETLTRYVVADYKDVAMRDRALERLRADPAVAYAEPNAYVDAAAGLSRRAESAKAAVNQSHRDLHDIDGAWALAAGWGLVGIVDSGLALEHPDLRSFTGADSASGTWVPGGNYLRYFAVNVGGFGQPRNDVSETLPSQTPPGSQACDPGNSGWLSPMYAGHGTHVAGLVAANGIDGDGASGSCRNCGLAVVKITNVVCSGLIEPIPSFARANVTSGITELVLSGAQVINASLADPTVSCSGSDLPALCQAIALAKQQDALVVAASGNQMAPVALPASHPAVVGVGGISGVDSFDAPVFWNDSPSNCPYLPTGGDLFNKRECGSNWRQGNNTSPYWNYQDFVASSKSVVSTFVPGASWNNEIGCRDSSDGIPGDGYGVCTGTSMSAPQVAGILGLARSVHPLLKVGSPYTHIASNKPGYIPHGGLRYLLRQTASSPVTNHARLGWGIPSARRLVERLLGQVGAELASNRVTPLFSLYRPGFDDYAAVATPQLAMGLVSSSPSGYRTSRVGDDTFVEGEVISGYTFPNPAAGTPRATALILTTERTRAGLPTPVPLFLMGRPSGHPLTGNDLIIVNELLVQGASDLGYVYAGRQGFIYPWCSGAGCNPPGTQALHLRCKNAASASRQCTVFLESQRIAFEDEGYTANFPGAARSQLGFAYPVLDSDGDGLFDGAEHVIGTSPVSWDSDGDGESDSDEYPFFDVPVSDPCAGPDIQCPHILNRIFKDGFE